MNDFTLKDRRAQSWYEHQICENDELTFFEKMGLMWEYIKLGVKQLREEAKEIRRVGKKESQTEASKPNSPHNCRCVITDLRKDLP